MSNEGMTMPEMVADLKARVNKTINRIRTAKPQAKRPYSRSNRERRSPSASRPTVRRNTPGWWTK